MLDETHIALPDAAGNNRLDSYSNLVENPHAGLLFLIPGKDETLRVNGTATLSTKEGLLGRFESDGRRPTLVLVLEVEELFGHCAKAFRRGRVWDPDSWWQLSDAPDSATIYASQFEGGDREAFQAAIDESYERDLGGD